MGAGSGPGAMERPGSASGRLHSRCPLANPDFPPPGGSTPGPPYRRSAPRPQTPDGLCLPPALLARPAFEDEAVQADSGGPGGGSPLVTGKGRDWGAPRGSRPAYPAHPIYTVIVTK
ncbi:hypothetical protein GCM10012286_14970 [Streptomyces lasiicapitis]|uniref:Uncharacterized protein n=1 Tax=Streptomyces lasiicapitis TaxID=1923961 RepID=A0ABQ2LL36_9ACTN|nr:hypothetical protein GCM10012286_14970 [Streptomyces lasiicapitis]